MIDAELLDLFIQESREHFETLEQDLLALETVQEDPELINRIFRSVHSIKGTSGFVGLTNITKLSHVMEHVMSLMRENTLKSSKPIVDALLAGFDKLRVMVADVANCHHISIDIETERLKKIVDQVEHPEEISTGAAPSNSNPVPDFLKDFSMLNTASFRNAIRVGRKLFLVRAYMHKDIKDVGKKPIDLFKAVESIGEFFDSYMDITGFSGLEGSLEQDLLCLLLCSTVLEADLLSEALGIPIDQIQQIDPAIIKEWLGDFTKFPVTSAVEVSQSQNSPPTVVEELHVPMQTTPVPQVQHPVVTTTPVTNQPKSASNVHDLQLNDKETSKTAVRQKTDETIRVSVSLLDDLMNLAGEMVLGRNQLLRLAGSVAQQVDGMTSVLQNISLVTSDLQEKVMRTRLQPIGSIFGKFHRIVRDLAGHLNKEIDLKIFGEEVELDKSIIEALSDPLTHLIRNCADHAIEMPDDRVSVGKPRAGQLKLTASHVGGQVLIEVIDDGRGIDPGKVKNKAIEKGLIKPDEADRMSDRQAQALIFLPGFSTAAQLSDISGRGVGMDVVKTNIEKLGGSVDIDSEVGKGTRISLSLPLTLAIIPALIVEVKKRRFAVPQINLEEIVGISEKNRIEMIRGSLVLRLREKLLSLVDLSTLLKMDETDNSFLPEKKNAYKKKYVLVLKADNCRFGIIVDKLLDSEEIVVKPLSLYLQSAECYSGATIMGDGKVALILEAMGIANLASLDLTQAQKETKEESSFVPQDMTEVQSVLLFRNGPSELFALNLAMVARIEKIRSKDIQRVGNLEYLKYSKNSLQLVRLHSYMAVSQPLEEPEYLYVIIPKLVHKPLGIIATKVEDAIQTAVALDEDSITGTGIIGTAVINQILTIFLDIYSLFETADPQHYRASSHSATLKTKRVLLAEDTAFFRSVELQYLKELVGHVDIAKNGIEAWELLNREAYDLLLTDIEMPGMNGLELTKRVRESEQLHSLPIVALTSLGTEQHIMRGKDAGIDAYETKLNKEHLKQTLETILLHGGVHSKHPVIETESQLLR